MEMRERERDALLCMQPSTGSITVGIRPRYYICAYALLFALGDAAMARTVAMPQ